MILMLRNLSKQNIQSIVYRNTPIDRINTIHEGYGFIEVQGNAGKDNLTYRIYENGTVVEK